MAKKYTQQEIEELNKQLKKKAEELKEIYGKLADAGECPLDDDILDDVAGGFRFPSMITDTAFI